MKCRLLAAAIVALCGAVGVAQADGNVEAGKSKAGPCAGCHGAGGEGSGTNPPLAGISAEKFVQAIGDFQSGKRSNSAMKVFAKKLKAEEVADLAAYYASLKK